MSLSQTIGWIAWGAVTAAAVAGSILLLWALMQPITRHFRNEMVAGIALRILLTVQVLLLGSISILFFRNDWNKLHILWIAPICLFPLLVGRLLFSWFLSSLEREKRFVEELVGKGDQDS